MIFRGQSARGLLPVSVGLILGVVFFWPAFHSALAVKARYLSPLAVALSPDGSRLYVTEHTGNALAIVETAKGTLVGKIGLPEGPVGVVVSRDGKLAYVACSKTDVVAVVDTVARKVEKTFRVGRAPHSLALSADGQTLYVCNRFSGDVSIVSTKDGREQGRAKAVREPICCALSEATRTLVVGNFLPLGSNNDPDLASVLTFINTATGQPLGEVRLPLGSNQVASVAVSPDGQWAYAAHILARFLLPTTQLERGWMNTNALSVVNVARRELYATVLLDDLDLGAANPAGVAVSGDGKKLFVSHRGSHEVTVIDLPGMHAAIEAVRPDQRADLANDLTFLYRNGLKRRFSSGGLGPCGIAAAPDGSRAWVANYFSDTVTVVDAERGKVVAAVALGPEPKMDLVRRGELLFGDARMCFQQWQTCESCHPQGRADGLMWDLLNDGLGNPKNTKALVLADKTPPMMALGIREDARMASRSGVRFIQFRQPEESDVDALEAYIKSLRPERGPAAPKDAVERGRKLFNDPVVGCAKCHPAPLYTDLNMYDVGTRGRYDRSDEFDTPTLVELWRSAPYLHDGSAVTIMDVLTTANREDKHGNTSHLTQQQLRDLEAFLSSL
ncbi:MAG: cell surface protein [Armatimonadetes bacterium]|nr:cell surface protein [Armatimonadota bacterium]